MRRSDREITDFKDILSVMKKCDVVRLAFNGDDCPYIIPLNFGLETEGEDVYLYFHGAAEGTKYEYIKRDCRASFEMDCEHRLVSEEDRGYCTMEYESVIGTGKVEILGDDKKEEALDILMSHYHHEHFEFSKGAMPATAVMRLKVEKMTAKRKMKK